LRKTVVASCLIWCFTFSTISANANDSDQILKIRQLYQSVEAEIKSNKLVKTTIKLIANEMLDIERGQDIVPVYNLYWAYNTGILSKVTVYIGQGPVIFEKEYLYSPKGEIVFVFEKVSSFEGNTLEEFRYYFDQKKLIRYMEGKEIIEKNYSTEVIDLSADKIREAETFQDVFKGILKLSTQ